VVWDGIVLAGAAGKGNAAGCHGLQPHYAEGLMPAVCQDCVGGPVDDAQEVLGQVELDVDNISLAAITQG
jgi:hypothetical protein